MNKIKHKSFHQSTAHVNLLLLHTLSESRIKDAATSKKHKLFIHRPKVLYTFLCPPHAACDTLLQSNIQRVGCNERWLNEALDATKPRHKHNMGCTASNPETKHLHKTEQGYHRHARLQRMYPSPARTHLLRAMATHPQFTSQSDDNKMKAAYT